MENIVSQQRDFFKSDKTKDCNFRIQQLKALKKVLKSNESLLTEAIYKDFKKSEFDCYTTELALLYSDINEACKKLKSWSKIKRVSTNLINFPAKSRIIPEPYGVSLIIGAWNYPYQLSFAPAIAAIAAGNTVILKPSEIPVNSSKAIKKIVNDNFKSNFFHVIEGGVQTTQQLLGLNFDKIFFTGSPKVGKIIYQAAAQHLTPVTLELGGKSPAIVCENSNIEVSAKRIVWGKFLNAGQTCIAPDYLLVHKNIKDKLISAIISEIERCNYSFANKNYVQIINEANMHRLVALLDKNKIIYGGDYDIYERYFAPTLMSDITFDDKVMQDEIFGPILPIIEFEKIEEISTKLKNLPKPLASYLFTGNKKQAHRLFNELSFGGGAVNDTIMHITNSKLPFGGVGNSGIGSYHGKSGFNEFTHYKSILKKSTCFEPNLKYSPYNEKKLKLARRIMG
ncbi:MAG TPA: aldehyde dehydrogenase family protein [Bacteroidales bacterium]|jgi:aldehyde dehydrogenase (NAD+)|nr:aldehyde dehydrogenase family protein [Bacteroidales bacterium]MDD4234984.1 aldehyde dehydrogenase family protein [Bacteroidales bacterium]HXK82475.1 aldehyde dehydrogenase family protein [Bacteroidales bacterium]